MSLVREKVDWRDSEVEVDLIGMKRESLKRWINHWFGLLRPQSSSPNTDSCFRGNEKSSFKATGGDDRKPCWFAHSDWIHSTSTSSRWATNHSKATIEKEFLRFVLVELIKEKQITFLARGVTKGFILPDVFFLFHFFVLRLRGESWITSQQREKATLSRNAFWRRNNQRWWSFNANEIDQRQRGGCCETNIARSLSLCFSVSDRRQWSKWH